MITAADADASPEICARRRAFPSPDEVVNGVEADQSHDDQIDRHDEAQQPRHDQDQDAREEGDERRDVGNGEGHCDSPKISIRSRLSLSETHTLKYWWCRPPRTGIASVRPTVWMVRGIGASGPSGQPFRGFAVGTGTHTWLYVGETGDLSDRPLSHERKPCFDKNGAN